MEGYRGGHRESLHLGPISPTPHQPAHRQGSVVPCHRPMEGHGGGHRASMHLVLVSHQPAPHQGSLEILMQLPPQQCKRRVLLVQWLQLSPQVGQLLLQGGVWLLLNMTMLSPNHLALCPLPLLRQSLQTAQYPPCHGPPGPLPPRHLWKNAI